MVFSITSDAASGAALPQIRSPSLDLRDE